MGYTIVFVILRMMRLLLLLLLVGTPVVYVRIYAVYPIRNNYIYSAILHSIALYI